jgi:hypothetical protein
MMMRREADSARLPFGQHHAVGIFAHPFGHQHDAVELAGILLQDGHQHLLHVAVNPVDGIVFPFLEYCAPFLDGLLLERLVHFLANGLPDLDEDVFDEMMIHGVSGGE